MTNPEEFRKDYEKSRRPEVLLALRHCYETADIKDVQGTDLDRDGADYLVNGHYIDVKVRDDDYGDEALESRTNGYEPGWLRNMNSKTDCVFFVHIGSGRYGSYFYGLLRHWFMDNYERLKMTYGEKNSTESGEYFFPIPLKELEPFLHKAGNYKMRRNDGT